MKVYVPFFILLSFISLNAHAYWSCAWPYKTEITVQENSGSNLTDYQVELSIPGPDLETNNN